MEESDAGQIDVAAGIGAMDSEVQGHDLVGAGQPLHDKDLGFDVKS